MWRSAGGQYGGGVPIYISSDSATAQLLNITLVDAAMGVPRFAQSSVPGLFCYDNSGGSAMSTEPANGPKVKRNSSGTGCVGHFSAPSAAINVASTYARLRVAGAVTEWDLTQTTIDYPYLFLAPHGPVVEIEVYCNAATDCGLGVGYFPQGQIVRSCPISVGNDLLTTFNSATEEIAFWFKKSGC